MSRLRLYIDQDALDGSLIRGLRSREIDVMTAAEAGMIRRTDEGHLSFAAAQGRAIHTFNVRDFHELHSVWMAARREHAGMILARQKRYSTGEQIRRLVLLVGSLTGEAMRNRGEFLGLR